MSLSEAEEPHLSNDTAPDLGEVAAHTDHSNHACLIQDIPSH